MFLQSLHWRVVITSLLLMKIVMPNCFSQKLELKSKYFDEDRELNISLPEGYECSKASYPIVIVFDGDVLFNYVSSLFEYNYDVYQPSIIVGVSQQERDKELVHNENSKTNLNFFNFINKELIPSLEKKYRGNNSYILIGHSFGGVFVLDCLFNNDKIKYAISISPTLWGKHKETMLSKVKNEKKQKQKKLYLGFAENEHKALKSGVVEFSDIIKASYKDNLDMCVKEFTEEDHNSSILIGARKGLTEIFKNWITVFPEKEWDTIEKEKKPSLFYDYFDTISKEMDKEIIPSEEDYNSLGYYFVEEKENDKAIVIFEKNISLYPCSSNAYDSLAETYLTMGNVKKALYYYKKALKIEKKSTNNYSLLKQYKKKIAKIKNEL